VRVRRLTYADGSAVAPITSSRPRGFHEITGIAVEGVIPMNQFVQEAAQWGGLVLGGVGTLLSLAGLVSNRTTRRKAQRIESNELLDRAWDIFAGRSGSTWLFEQKNEAERIEEARRLIDKAFSLDKRYPKAHMYLGVYWQFMGEYQRALICHQKAIELDPTYASAYNNLGRTNGQLGDSKAELESYKLALKYDSDFAYARYNLGDALFRMGDFDNAILQLEWVTKRRYCPGKVFMKLGDAYLAAGYKEKANIQYRTAAQLGIAEAESRLEKLFAQIYSSSP